MKSVNWEGEPPFTNKSRLLIANAGFMKIHPQMLHTSQPPATMQKGKSSVGRTTRVIREDINFRGLFPSLLLVCPVQTPEIQLLVLRLQTFGLPQMTLRLVPTARGLTQMTSGRHKKAVSHQLLQCFQHRPQFCANLAGAKFFSLRDFLLRSISIVILVKH